MLRIDNREVKTIPYFSDAKIMREIVQLKVADYQYHSDMKMERPLYIERKSYKDLGQSLGDGRIWTFETLKREANIVNAIPILIVEGRKIGGNRRRGGVSETQLLKIIDTLMLRHGIQVILTQNPKHTAERIEQLIHHYNWGKHLEFEAIAPWTFDETKRMKQILTAIPGISLMTCTAFLKAGLGLKSLFHVDEKTIANLCYSSGSKIGEKRAANIMKALGDHEVRLKIVCKLPSVGPKTAVNVLNSLIQVDWDVDKVQNIQPKQLTNIKPYFI